MKLNQKYKEKCSHKRIKILKNQVEVNLIQKSFINEFTNPNLFLLDSSGQIMIKKNTSSSSSSSLPLPSPPPPSSSSSSYHNNNNQKNESERSQFLLESKENGIIWLHLPNDKEIRRINNKVIHSPIIKKSINQSNQKKSSNIPDYYKDPLNRGLNEIYESLTKIRSNTSCNKSRFLRTFDPNDLSFENLLLLDQQPPTIDDITRTGLSIKDINKITSITINSPPSSSSSSSSLNMKSLQLVCSICQDELNHQDSAVCLPKCCHIFHGRCIGPWFTTHSDCPNCRQRIA